MTKPITRGVLVCPKCLLRLVPGALFHVCGSVVEFSALIERVEITGDGARIVLAKYADTGSGVQKFVLPFPSECAAALCNGPMPKEIKLKLEIPD
jgi:hypothetical protein